MNKQFCAFPVATVDGYSQYGMTLRDYFAAHAPITVQDAMVVCGIDSNSIGTSPRNRRVLVMEALAEMRADYADAMLAERAK